MATDFSSRYVADAEHRLRWSLLGWKMRVAPSIKRWRMLLRFLQKNKNYPATTSCGIGKNLEGARDHFQRHSWAFIERIFDNDFHAELIRLWPPRHYFDAPKKIIKSYDIGFTWTHGQAPDFRYSDPYGQHQLFKSLLSYLRSAEFSERMTNFVGIGKPIRLYSFIAHMTHSGSEVIPHKDVGDDDPRRHNYFLNILFFVNGTGGKNSGGLALSRDNELRDIIIEPENLRNTCLMYDSRANFYHGFRPVKHKKFRWAIGAQFCEEAFTRK